MSPRSGASFADGDVERIQTVLDGLGYGRDPEGDGTAARWLEVLRDYAPRGEGPEIKALYTQSCGPVIVRALPFHSLCVHHLLPFFGTADIGFVPRGRLVGIGSIPKVLTHFARQPQLQERLGEQIAQHLAAALEAPVAVRLRARHMCMEMRGAAISGEVETLSFAGPDPESVMGLLGPA